MKKLPRDIDVLLEEITVHDDRDAAVEAGNTSWPEGWFAVSHPKHGLVAYFMREDDALRFRLDWINRLLNPTSGEDEDDGTTP